MSAPATCAAPSSTGSDDWADILEAEGNRSRSMTAGFAADAATSRKRTLTNFSVHDPAFAENSVSPPAKSPSASASLSARSANMTANLSVAEYYTRCKKVAEARVEDMVLRHHKHRTNDEGRPPPPQVPAPPAPQRLSRKNTITSFMRSTSAPEAERQACRVCRRSLRFFGKGACELCASVVCGRCRVTKKLFTFDHGVFNPVKMEFCTECVVSTNTMNSSWAAARELELASAQDDGLSEADSLRSGSQRRHGRLRKAYSIESDDSVDDERYTMVSGDYNNGSGYDRSSRVWIPSDRVRRPTADILASIRSEPEEDERSGHPAFFTEEEDDGDVFPIIEMPSDDEGDDSGPTNHAVDLVVLYNP
ncbi:hypothetical protein PybrP1_006597 [[Pythium] brassicae (nom. inval.)]|nr:hypothetical protein PybrP1_006597 [[Pythium] brassicae (nom. inval.)]